MNEQKVLCAICLHHILPDDKIEPFGKGLAHKDCFWGQESSSQEDQMEQGDALRSTYCNSGNKSIID